MRELSAMLEPPWIFGLFIIVFFLGFLGAALAMQVLRSRLVQTLLVERSPLTTEVSDWTMSGGRPPGYFNAIKREYIWGQKSEPLLSSRTTNAIIRKARFIYVVREIARYAILVGGVLFFGSAFLIRHGT